MIRILCCNVLFLVTAAAAAEPEPLPSPSSALYVWRDLHDEIARAAQLFRADKMDEGRAILRELRDRYPVYAPAIWPETIYQHLVARDGRPDREVHAWLALGDNERALASATAAKDEESAAWAMSMLGRENEAADFYERRASARKDLIDSDNLPRAKLLRSHAMQPMDPEIELNFVVRHVTDNLRILQFPSSGPSLQRCLEALKRLNKLLETERDDKLRRRAYELIFLVFAGLHDETGLRAWENRAVHHEAWITDDDKSEILCRRGDAAKALKQTAEAEKFWRIVGADYPKSTGFAKSQYKLGLLLQEQAKYEAAIKEYARLFDIVANPKSPNEYTVYYNQYNAAWQTARCYESLEKFDEAVVWASKAREKMKFAFDCGTCALQAAESLDKYIASLQSKIK